MSPSVVPPRAQLPGDLDDLAAAEQPTEALGVSYLKLDQHRPAFEALL